MTYDSWLSTNPADEFLGPEPDQGGLGEQIVTHFDPKPIPDRRFDWTAVLADYDLGHPIGFGPTEAEATRDLIMQIEGVRQ